MRADPQNHPHEGDVYSMDHPLPFNRSYWVDDGKLLAGCYPGAEDIGETDAKLAGLVNAGIGTVINLMESHEVSWGGKPFRPYQDRIIELGKASGIDVHCHRFPIRDTHIPAPIEMKVILDAIDNAVARGHGAYVHCWGGKGRTGTVVGCYLIRRNRATPENFVDVIRDLRGPDAKSGPSPENQLQIQFVRDFCTT